MPTSFPPLLLALTLLLALANPLRAGEPVELRTVQVRGERPTSVASDQEIRNQDFMAFPRRTASDLLRFIPGLHITQHTGGAKAHQIFLRGFDAEHGRDVAAFLDGIPLNEVSHVHGDGYLDLHFLIPESLRRIWVMKGPYDPRFGPFATAGVIDFRPWVTRPHQVLASVGGGSHASAEGLVEFARSWAGGDSLLLLQGDRSAGYTDPGEQRAGRLFFSHRLPLGARGSLRLLLASYGVASEAADILPLSLIEDGQIGRFEALDRSNRVDVTRHLAGLRFDWRGARAQTRAQLYGNLKDSRIFSNYTFFYFDPESGDQLAQIDERVYGGADWAATLYGALGPVDLSSELGVQARADRVGQHQSRSQARRVTQRLNRYDFTQSSLGIYLDERADIAEILRVVAGLRLDLLHYDGSGTQDRYGPIDVVTNVAPLLDDDPFRFRRLLWTVSPKLSLALSATEDLTIFLNGGQSFVPPHARQIAWSASKEVPTVQGAELGASWHGLDGLLQVSAAGWWARKDGESVFDSEVGLTVPRGRSQRLGVDAELRVNPWPWMRVGTDLYWVRARFEDGSRVPNQADWLMTNVLALDHPNGVAASLRGRFVGERHHDLGYRSPASYVLDLQGGYTWRRLGPLSQLRVTLAVENLLDATWYDSVFAYPSRPWKGGEVVEGLHATPGTPLAAKLRVTASY